MVQTIPRELLRISRTLRKKQTPWEHKLWQYLRANRLEGVQFKRQVRLGNYIVDLYCASKKLVIELDGGQHSEQDTAKRDKEKEQYLRNQGYTVLRFWNNEIDQNFDGVLEEIRNKIVNPSPNLSPRQERGEKP